MPMALLSGGFGRRDPGDETVLDAFVKALDDWDMTVTTHDPVATGSRNGHTLVPAGASRALLRAARTADAVVCAGGPLISDLGPVPAGSLRPLGAAVPPIVASLSPAKYLAFVGVGAGGWRAGKRGRPIRRLMAGADLIVVRDKESARALQEGGAPSPLRIGADPSWAVLPEPVVRSRLDGSVLIVVRLEQPADAMLVALINIARELRAAGLEVGLLPWRDAGAGAPDVSLVRAIGVAVSGCAVHDPARDLPETMELMSGWGATLSTSFHGVVAGAASGAACIALSSSPDMKGLAATLGSPSISPSSPAGGVAGVVLRALLDGPVSTAAVKESMAASKEGFRLLRLVLSGGRSETDDIAGLTLGPDRWPP